MGRFLHKVLCRVGLHSWGELFNDNRKRTISVELPRYREFVVEDTRVYRKCSVCGKKELIVAVDSPLT